MSGKLVGIIGRAGAGKSTVAIELELTHDFDRMRFAEPMKAAMAALGLSVDEYDGHLKETPCALLMGKTPRYAMQTLGTEWGRNMIDENLWAKNWQLRALKKLDSGISVCVDDVRFPNEVEIIKSMGGTIIRIDRPGTQNETATKAHASEAFDQLEFDHRVINDNTIPILMYRVRELLKL